MIMSKYGRVALPLLVLTAVVTSCFPTTSLYDVDLSQWNADSENVTELRVLIEDEGVEHSPVIINQRYLMFQSQKNGNDDLWYVDLSQRRGVSQLTTYNGPDRVPAPHPDGKRYVFLSDRGEVGYYQGEFGKPTSVFLAEAREPENGGWSRGEVSPDGKLFLYVSGKYIWTFDLKTKTKTQFVQGSQPRFAPDGNKIIFQKYSQTQDGVMTSSIWTMNQDGSQLTEMIGGDSKFSYANAMLSPDGTRIIYEKRRAQGTSSYNQSWGPSDLWVCRANGTEHTQITTHPLEDVQPYWKDNETVIFVSNRPQSGQLEDKTFDIWQMKLSL